ncbi:lethal(3)malignant brain tumor-like protein 4 isoform X2 [Stegostoma tigrinum]|uniref:lethal(3)malignant brain tumor-like protein 4 isoform X2 n=1 Tax=Stegostoma tigrinum TaxID=3053191 RepID=UPI00286FFA37|nr:lethal(3)malignant brain tumor-like protein 4 isoform X2 [Stegostoma tigrinum]
MNAGDVLEGPVRSRATDGSQLIASSAIPTEMTAEVGLPLNLTVSNSEGGTMLSEEKGWQAVPIKIERMDEEAESSSAADVQDFDIYSAMEWKNGVGILPGSDLKFRMNEFGALEIITTEEQDEAPSAQITDGPTNIRRNVYSEASNVQEGITEGGSANDMSHMEGICCFENCGSYRVMEESNQHDCFCGTNCQQQYKVQTCKSKSYFNTRFFNRKPIVEHVPIKQNAGTILKCIKKRKKKVSANLKEDSDEDFQDGHMEEVRDDGKMKIKMSTVLTNHLNFKNNRFAEPNSKFSKQAVPLPGKKKAWSWQQYLEEEKALAAPPKLFKECQLVPQIKNGFKVGMRLEGIDPRHPSMFCVLSVAEVCGVRLRLHFDGYSECFDFWTNIDSPDIHPVGWCEKTSRKLHLPKGYKDEEFNWASYLKTCKAQPAPKNLFKVQNTTVTPSGFRVGMKLEAVDRKNPSLICVATVTDIIDNRFLVHFDNWDDTYDYWCDASSPYIHPVGWCQEQGKTLTPPQGHSDAENFSWKKYLEELGATSAPARAFKARSPHGFQVKMKLEAVDRRNPMLIRVATIVDVDDQRIKVCFDGWSHNYDLWFDADHSDIHPAGWCAKTGHPLQPPLSSQDLVAVPTPGGCPTPGCKGVGHIKGARYTGHHSAFGCPYSELNLKKESIQDRLGGEKQMTLVPIPLLSRTKRLDSNHSSGKPDECVNEARRCPTPGCDGSGHVTGKYAAHHRVSGCPLADQKQIKIKIEPQDEEGPSENKAVFSFIQRKRTKHQGRLAQPAKYMKMKEETDDIDLPSLLKDLSVDSMQQALHQSVFMSAMSAHPVRDLPFCWEQHCKLLPGVVNFRASKVSQWSIDEVANFVQTLPGCKEQAKTFKEEQIDGEAFLLLTQVDIVKILSIKLGPALKIYNSILMFKNSEDNLE